MTERLQKIISAAGLCSRRAAEELISAGRVTVNGVVAALGDKADTAEDIVLVDGKPLPAAGGRLYIMLNKPRGYVTTMSDEQGRKSVTDLVSEVGTRVYPVGRLDMNSDGLLIMTNDGEFAELLMHPSHNFKKTYHAYVTGSDIDRAADILRGPMELDGHALHPATVEVLRRFDYGALLSVTISEGRNRQVRRMCAVAGLEVKRLCRVSEGPLSLGNLPSGKWRYLTEKEISLIRS